MLSENMPRTSLRKLDMHNIFYFALILLSTESIALILSFGEEAMNHNVLIRNLIIGGSVSLTIGALLILVLQRLRTAEVTLKHSNDLSSTILNGIKDAVSVVDANTYRILRVNAEFLEQFDLKEQDVIGKACYEVTHRRITPCSSSPDHPCPLEKTRSTGLQSAAQHVHYCGNGQKMFYEISSSPLRDREGSVTKVVLIGRNVTERKSAEEKLRESNERYRRLSQEFRTLLDAIPDRLLLLSPELKVQWTNKGARSEMGRETSDLTGEYCYRLWHGRSVPCECCHALLSFQSGNVEGSQHRTLDGRHWDSRAFPIKDANGKVESVITVARDVTDRVLMEEEAKLTQAKLIHTNKMASLGMLVSGIAHEINNPNNLILFNGQLVSDIWNDVLKSHSSHHGEKGDFLLGGLQSSEVIEAVPALISGMMEGAKRIKSIVDNLKDYSRNGTSRLNKPTHINSVISSSISILGNEIRKYTENFAISLSSDIPAVRGNPQQLEQVVINLILNALQSLPDRRRGVRITTFLDEASVVMQVKDEGVGMSKDILERIGEPFFTTKLCSGGTGLGISICQSIIRDHKGSLEFNSSPDGGTMVSIGLPLPDTYTKAQL
jgi:PAS domain S-box-containing protein